MFVRQDFGPRAVAERTLDLAPRDRSDCPSPSRHGIEHLYPCLESVGSYFRIRRSVAAEPHKKCRGDSHGRCRGHGRGQGIGKATAQRLAHDGHHIVAVDRNGENAAKTAAEVGGESRVCDVTDRDAVLAMAQTVDGCDILINNAGIWRFHSLLDMTEDDAQSVLAVNVLGIVWCLQAFVPKMIERGGGSIVSLSSGAAWTNHRASASIRRQRLRSNHSPRPWPSSSDGTTSVRTRSAPASS